MDITQDNLSADMSPYQVHSRREIIKLLRSLVEHRQMINMVANRGDAAIVTSVLEVDEDAGSVIIDCAQRELINDRLLASDNISFETTLEQIRILFFAVQVESCMHDNAPALRIALPQTLVRLQRREFYRVPTPVINPASCTISIPQDDSDLAVHTIRLVLHNVSGGGVAVIDEHAALDGTIGHVYRNCRIDLPGGTLVVATLQLRNLQELRLPNGKQVRRMGCVFVDLPHAMLAAIQRYITKLEREQNARAAGRLG
jgi:c-di-GMP-binding flagellar brake protein YcgR